MATGEQGTFIFALVFIVFFSTLLTTMPIDLQGLGGTGAEITPLSPSAVYDYSSTEYFNTTEFTPFLTLLTYEYTLNSRDWVCSTDNETSFDLNAKIYWLGLWFGQLDTIRFISQSGIDRSLSISFDEMEIDATNGIATYSLIYAENGNSAGDFIFYWNSTLYSDPNDAWDNDVLYFLHGMGIDANTDVISLLVGLLFLQLPECPILINALIATPIWACVIFLIWFIIKESLPFV